MRKNAVFGVTAFGFTAAMILLAISMVAPTDADVIRPKTGIPQVGAVAPFLPGQPLEPAW